MSIETCTHSVERFKQDPFVEKYKPTSDEIKEHKLWKCPKCGYWYSLIGKPKNSGCV